MSKNITRNETIEANKKVHSYLVNAGEYQKSPHFLPENIAKVKGILNRATQNLPPKSDAIAVDFGCGTGFMIDLMRDRFREVHGVDITQDMMKHVDLTSGNVFLHESLAENTPFSDNFFDFATAYSFMDHLFDYTAFLKEVYRVLKPNGVFYSDLNPNRAFILALDEIERTGREFLSPIIEREITGALHNGKYYEDKFGLNAKCLETAEPIKSIQKGFCENEVKNAAKAIGFSDCRIEFEWFLGQGKVIHTQSHEKAEAINEYLLTVLPVSSQLYKYLRFIFIK